MARKRLNKKVALIGSLVFVVVGLVLIIAILGLSRDPEKFIVDGNAAVKTANEATDKQTRDDAFERAERNYGKARNLAKTDSLRIEILFKAADMYFQWGRWPNVMGCWSEIVKIDPLNIKARYPRFKSIYITADGMSRIRPESASGIWREAESQASEFIELIEKQENENLISADTTQFECFGLGETEALSKRLGPFLYLTRSRAVLGITEVGAVTDQTESLARATNDLKKVQELEPDNVNTYLYLARAELIKWDIIAKSGNITEKEKAAEQARQYLDEAFSRAGNDPGAQVVVIEKKRDLRHKLARDSGEGLGRDQVLPFESEYLSLVERFPSSPEAYAALAKFYAGLGPKYLDKATEAAEKTFALDKENAQYARFLANLHYRVFSVLGEESGIHKAIEVAENALELPGARDESGPRQYENKMNRLSLYVFLANCYIGQVLDQPDKPGVGTESQRQQWIEKGEQMVREIEQLVGSGENMYVVKWQGMLELAKGDTDSAVRKMYAAYEQFKALDPEYRRRDDPVLSYRLAKVFENTAETGAVFKFLESAVHARIGYTRPEAILDYADVISRLRAADTERLLLFINNFEDEYWTNLRSRRIRLLTLIRGRRFDEAEKELADSEYWPADDPNTIKAKLTLLQAKIQRKQGELAQMQKTADLGILSKTDEEGVITRTQPELLTTEIKGYVSAMAELMTKLLKIDPDSVEELTVADVCNNLRAEGKIDQAKAIANQFLEYFPDNVTGLLYREVLSEPEPQNISRPRFEELREKVLSNISDPIRRAVNLGLFYHRNNELEKAVSELRKILDSRLAGGDKAAPARTGQGELADLVRVGITYLFNTAVALKDWELAEQVVELARRENMDNCEGRFFESHIAHARQQYADALAKVDQCLKLRPVYSNAYVLRSNINSGLGNRQAAVEDAQKAAFWNPLNGAVAKLVASALYARNLGKNVLPSQILEAKDALDKAVALNPTDTELLSFYAEYISSENRDDIKQQDVALALRQRLQRTAPSVRNARLLGRQAMRTALAERNPERKEFLFDVANSAFEDARKMDPNDKLALSQYAEYLRARGLQTEAEQLILEADDRQLLWLHYSQSGQFDNAKNVLEQLYQNEPEDSNVVRGLLLVSERTGDTEAVKKYSERLLVLEDNVDNHLFQIQMFLKSGLVKETEHKLQSLKEKYPDEPRVLLLDAWLTMRRGRLKDALVLTNRSLETEYDKAAAWRLRGEIHRLRANYEQAISDLRQSKSLFAAEERDTSFDELLTRYYLAKVYWQAGRLEDAITELETIVDDSRAPVESRQLLERVYLQTRRKAALKRFYDGTLTKLPGSVFWRNRAAAFAMAEGDFSRAQQLYAEVLQKGDMRTANEAIALDGYLQALIMEAGDPSGTGGSLDPVKLDKVFEEAGKYLDSDSASIAFLRMAEAKLKLGDKDSSVEYCRKAVDKAGTDEVFASGILRRMYLLVGAEEVLKYCKEKLEADSDSLAANFTMFNLMKLSGDYNKALVYIDKCLEIIGPDSPLRVNYGLNKTNVLQMVYTRTSDKNYLVGAIAEYESLLAKMPNSINVLNNLAYTLAENNERLAEALKYAKRACDEAPNNPGLLDTYAYALYKNGQYEKADESLQSALQQFEHGRISAPADVYDHLGMIKEKRNMTTEAVAAYKQALEIGAQTLSETAKERISAALKRIMR